MPAGRPPKYETPDEMQRIIDLYFLACRYNRSQDDNKESLLDELSEEDVKYIKDIDDYKPTISGLAYSLGMSTEALRNYEAKDKFLATVSAAKQRVEMALEQHLYTPSPNGVKFSLINNFKWKDKTETEHSGSINFGNMTDEQIDEEIKKREAILSVKSG